MLENINNALVKSYDAFFNQMAAYTPKLIGALIILIVGWIAAKLIKMFAVRVLKLIKLNVVTEKSGIDKFLADGGIKNSAVDIVGQLFYWLIMLIVILTAFNSLGLQSASAMLNQIVLFIPNVIIAVLVLLFGMFLSNFVASIVTTYFKNIEVEQADMLGKITRYSIVIFVISIALAQLNIGQDLVTSVLLIILGASGLALALAFGLGGRDWAAGMIKKWSGK